jgi:hypothetical protein
MDKATTEDFGDNAPATSGIISGHVNFEPLPGTCSYKVDGPVVTPKETASRTDGGRGRGGDLEHDTLPHVVDIATRSQSPEPNHGEQDPASIHLQTLFPRRSSVPAQADSAQSIADEDQHNVEPTYGPNLGEAHYHAEFARYVIIDAEGIARESCVKTRFHRWRNL